MCQCIIIMFIPCVHSVYAAMSFKLFVFMLNEYFLFVVCHLSFVCLMNWWRWIREHWCMRLWPICTVWWWIWHISAIRRCTCTFCIGVWLEFVRRILIEIGATAGRRRFATIRFIAGEAWCSRWWIWGGETWASAFTWTAAAARTIWATITVSISWAWTICRIVWWCSGIRVQITRKTWSAAGSWIHSVRWIAWWSICVWKTRWAIRESRPTNTSTTNAAIFWTIASECVFSPIGKSIGTISIHIVVSKRTVRSKSVSARVTATAATTTIAVARISIAAVPRLAQFEQFWINDLTNAKTKEAKEIMQMNWCSMILLRCLPL